jgi:non-ribosomal peptide synthase protein (TIGR01720 family)
MLWSKLQPPERSEPIRLAAKTTSFQKWAETLVNHAQSEPMQVEQQYWLSQKQKEICYLPRDYNRGENTVASSRMIQVQLSDKHTQALLREAPKAYRTQIEEVLLTAILRTFVNWTGRRRVLVDMEWHGRAELVPDLDLSRTVGWFTTIYPILLESAPDSDLGRQLQSIKEQLRAIPQRGIGYGLLQYLSNNRALASKLQKQPKAEVVFNYLGQFDQALDQDALFEVAQENGGPSRDPSGARQYLIEINGHISGGRLRMNWNYSQNLHREETIQHLADSFLQSLQSLIIHCQSPEVGVITPADFPEIKLTSEQLEALLLKVGFNQRGAQG